MAEMSGTIAEPKTVGTGTGPEPRPTRLMIEGMTCGNCARHVTDALQSVPGVRSATVNLDANQATVRWQLETAPNDLAAIQAVEKEGFGARVAGPECEPAMHRTSGWGLNLWIGLPVTAILMFGEWALGLGMVPWFQWSSFVLAGLVQVLAGARFYRGAWAQLKVGQSNMDTLVALGSTTAFAYSTWALLAGHGGHLYFMEAAAIISLISAGHWMEARVSSRASSALRKLLNLAPAMALKREPDGSETEVAVAAVLVGDEIVLRPGDRVPVDGTVSEGASAVDESMLTGESVPVDKAPGDLVYTGTLNLNGRITARVTATGEQTALAHIVAAVQRAQSSRAKIQRLGDQFSSIFVPLVVGIALLAGLWWGLAPQSATLVHQWLGHYLWQAHGPESGVAAGFIIAAAVLIIACPCAMGLATPAAIMAGSNAAAERGILIRDGVALEKAGEVGAVVFDKTGTLTMGKPKVVEVAAFIAPIHEGADPGAGTASSRAEADEIRRIAGTRPSPPLPEAEVRRLAASLARSSTHPLSKVIAQLAQKPVEVAAWQELRGSGLQGRIKTTDAAWQEVRLGSLRWLADCGVELRPGDTFVSKWSSQGATIVGLAQDRVLLGLIAVQDTLKAGAPAVVRRLQESGLKTYLITGDNKLTAASIAQQAGIPAANVFAEIRPEEKAALVKKLQSQGEHVAFVGDGINDAPALEQADLGIAVSRASDIAREAADIILLKSEIEAIPESLGLARATLRTIRQNLFWAFFYNALGIPLAALGFMSPILCAAAMGLSDLVVIGNALRLRRWSL